MKSTQRNRGAALVITLAMIAMLTFLVVAFFSRAVANVQIQSSSNGNTRADILLKSACEIVVSDFKSEIVAGSTVLGSTGQPKVYYPLSATTSVPALSRVPGLPTYGTPSAFVNLVKQSAGRFYPDVAPYDTNVKPIIQTATELTSDIPSLNGRSVIRQRWDDPTVALIPSGPLLLVSPVDPPPNYSRFYSTSFLPHWVMMTRQGVPTTQTWTTDWKNYSPDNDKAAIGRFAYNIYNVGGLLDINTVGYQETSGATSLTVNAVGQKGTLGLAKLSLIPGIPSPADANAAKFTQKWRNSASGSSVENYLAYLGFPKNGTTDLTGNPFFMLGPKSGFLTAAVGAGSSDSRILSRQDLIRLAVKTPATSPPYGINTASLPYLTHFSREVNAPSWAPALNASAPAIGGKDGTPVAGVMPYAYATNRDNSVVPNRFLPNVRVSPGADWTRLTGEKAVEGEPLIKYRFPLSWLALLQDADPSSTRWDLTPEAVLIVNTLDARNLANGGTGLGGATLNEKAAWLVQRAFGLLWNQGKYRWDYTGSPNAPTAVLTAVTDSIKVLGSNSSATLAVCKDTREPNFFELLKAGILSGSLGSGSDYESLCVTMGEDANPDNQVVQIGANIIDQADSDSYPTRIAFGKKMDNPSNIRLARSQGGTPRPTSEDKVIFGVEDVPYIYTFLSTPYRIPPGEGNVHDGTFQPPMTNVQNATQDSIDCWLQFVMWKPQQQASSTAVPPKFRIYFTGSDIHMYYQKDDNATTPFMGINYSTFNNFTTPALSGSAYVTFDDTPAYFRVPTLLGGMGLVSDHGFLASQREGNGVNPHGSAQLPRGMWMGETIRPEYNPAVPLYNKAPVAAHTEWRCQSDTKFELQFKDGSGEWRTYQQYNRLGVGTGSSGYGGRPLYGYADGPTDLRDEGCPGFAGPPWFRQLDVATIAMSAIDPRSQRYGLLAQYRDYNPDKLTPAMLPPATWKNYLKQGWAPKAFRPWYSMLFGPTSSDGRFVPAWTGGTADNPWYHHDIYSPIYDPTTFWADNASKTTTPPIPADPSNYYKDMDGVQRRGDGDSANNVRPIQLTNGTPLTADTQDLGRVLNRPFRNVGELAYVFRDEPYKSLNLMTANSADSALLDLFSVNEQPAMVAGKVNLNTAMPEVLQAIIGGAAREDLSATNTISAADALTYATALTNGTDPSKTDPATKKPGVPLVNPSEIANRLVNMIPYPASPAVADQNTAIKSRREVIGRALAGSGQTRTWNFLVDIIAQSGRYAPNATASAQFVVEGEKRYWLHLAIDRYTGQVVDQQFEPVLE